MRELLLNHLFRIITDLRRIEISLINDRQPENAAKVRQANKTFSGYRDRLITAQLTEAADKLSIAADQLQTTAEELSSCLSARETANNRLNAILSNLPEVIALLNTLIR